MTVYEHTVPAGLLIVALLLLLLAGAFSAWRSLPRNTWNAVLGVLYVAALLVLSWCLLLPGQKDATTRLLKPRFLVALDTSSSMTLKPSDTATDRWTVAGQALKQPWAQAVGAECEIEVFPFASKVGQGVPVEAVAKLKPEGQATLLRDGLKQIADRFSGLNVAGALLLSDGIDTREVLDDWAGDDRPFPVYALRLEPPGEWLKEPDLRIDGVTTSRRVTVGWKSEFKVRVSGQGTRGTPVVVQVFKDGVLAAEKPTQIADDGGERELVFEIEHAEVGNFSFKAALPALPGEKNTDDNEFVVPIQVVDASNGLLYLEGIPRWEYKFLRRVLLAQDQVSPAIYYTGADGSPQGATQSTTLATEMRPSQLALFKIIVLGNLDAEELGEERARNIVKFVEDGGSLVLLGGRQSWAADGFFQTGLSKVMPVRAEALKAIEAEKPFPVLLTDTARAHPAFAGDPEFWEIIPPLLSVFSGATLSPGAQVLVNAESPEGPRPVVVTQRYGQGKVAVILTDSFWRWQLGPEASRTEPYKRFWTQLISWLLPEEEELEENKVEVFAERDQFFLGEEFEIHARVGGDGSASTGDIECKVTFPDGRELPYKMSSKQIALPSGKTFPGFVLPLTADEPGLHTAVASAGIDGASVRSEPFSFFVRPYSPETRPRPMKTEVLQKITTASSGAFFENLDDLDAGLSALKFNSIEEETAEFESLWRNWLLIGILMGLLTVSWGMRKMRNMP